MKPVSSAASSKIGAASGADVEAESFPERRPFPVEVLPEPLRSLSIAGAEAIGCDPVFVAATALAACAIALGRRRALKLKPNWTVLPILWVVVVGESGTTKSPAFRLATAPLEAMEDEAARENERAGEEYRRAKEIHEKEHAAWKRRKGAEGDAPPEPPPVPPMQRVVTHDSTVEAIVTLLRWNPLGIGVIRDELRGWFAGFDRYSKNGGGDEAAWLPMHHGGAVTVDRKTGIPPTIRVPAAVVSIVGGIQPGILRRTLDPAKQESGLSARLLFACAPRRAKQWTEAVVDQRVLDDYAAAFRKLHAMQPGVEEDGSYRPEIVELSPEAKREFVAFYDVHNREQAELESDLASAWSKLEEYAARLALIVHCIRWSTGDPTCTSASVLDAESMRAGIQLNEWFKNEAKRFYEEAQEDDSARERRELVEWLERQGGAVSLRRAYKQGLRRLRGKAAATAALDRLAAAGLGTWIEPTGDDAEGRRFKLIPVDPMDPGPAGDIGPSRRLSKATPLFVEKLGPSSPRVHGSTRGAAADPSSTASAEGLGPSSPRVHGSASGKDFGGTPSYETGSKGPETQTESCPEPTDRFAHHSTGLGGQTGPSGPPSPWVHGSSGIEDSSIGEAPATEGHLPKSASELDAAFEQLEKEALDLPPDASSAQSPSLDPVVVLPPSPTTDVTRKRPRPSRGLFEWEGGAT